jgi:hypothetical protein
MAVYVVYAKRFRASHGVGRLEEEMIPAEHSALGILL